MGEKKSKFLKNLKKELEETLGRKKLENNPKAKKLLKVIHHLQKQVSIKKNKVKSISEIVRVEDHRKIAKERRKLLPAVNQEYDADDSPIESIHDSDTETAAHLDEFERQTNDKKDSQKSENKNPKELAEF